jgi:hypothetical protein
MAITWAAQGQNRSKVKLPSSICDGVPSQTSVVMSAHSSVVGSMCHDQGALTPGSPRTMTPFGIDPSVRPASSPCACTKFSVPTSSMRNVSPTTSKTATGFAEADGAGTGSGVPGGSIGHWKERNGAHAETSNVIATNASNVGAFRLGCVDTAPHNADRRPTVPAIPRAWDIRADAYSRAMGAVA